MLFTGVNDETETTTDAKGVKTSKTVKKTKYEFGQVSDKLTVDAFGTDNTVLTVYSVKSASNKARDTTSLTILFNNPKSSKAKGGDFVGFSLPYQWCAEKMNGGFRAGKVGLTATLSETAAPPASTLTGVGDTKGITAASGCNFYLTLTDTKTLADAQNYTLVVGGIPTPGSAAKLWGTVRLSAGKKATGSSAWSHHHAI